MKLLSFVFSITLFATTFAQSWQDVGGGTNNSSHGMLVWDGKLINLGSFNNPCNRVAAWDGTSWTCLGGGVGIVARAGCVWNGNLVVVGDFWNNFQPCAGCNGVAVWDGTSWSALDQGFNNDVLTCTVYNGDLIIGGDFTQANGVPINRVARWNETLGQFESMGAVTDMDNDVRCMTVYDGELWVGGDFNNIGGQGPLDGVVKWDETNDVWVGGNSGVDLIGGVNETVRVLYVNPNDGNLYMGGEFPELWDGDAAAEDFNMSGVAMYDGSNWYPLGTGLNEYCRAIHEYNGNLIVGGYFTTADGVACNKIAKWNGTTFSPMGLGFDASGIDEYVKSATVWNGIFFAGGAYTQAEGNPMNYIAQWYEAPSNPPVSVISSGGQTEACEGGCIDFSDNSTNSPTSWSWSFPGSSTPTSTLQHPGTICYPTAGTYTVSLQACNTNGCNTSTLDVTIGTAPTLSVSNASICAGETTTITATPSAGGGDYLWSTGETTNSIVVSPGSTTDYTVEYTLNGCTSTLETSTVTVTPSPTVTVADDIICEGESVTLTATPSVGGGTYSWSTGGNTQSITVSPVTTTTYDVDYTVNGCTSPLSTSTVTVNPVYNLNEAITTCQGSTVTYPDGATETITANTSHVSNLSSVYGCDSTITTTVTMDIAYSNTENTAVCSGSDYTYPDGTISTNITVNESHVSNLTTIGGCDSTITTNLTVNAVSSSTENINVCSGASHTYPDGTVSNNITTNESHVSNLVAANGCDSTVTTNVAVDPSYNLNEAVTACSGEMVTYPDGTTETVMTNTTHISSLQTTSGCDSTITTAVTVNPEYALSEAIPICDGATITYPDGVTETITANTSHISNLSSVYGCDSVITTNVTLAPNYNLTNNQDLCSGASFTYPDGTVSTNVTVNESHVSNLVTANGCDSVITTNINVVTAYVETENVTICSGSNYTYPDGTTSTNVTTNESHVSDLVSTTGCDSTVTTNLNVAQGYDIVADVTLCSGSDYTYPDGTVSTNITANESHVSSFTSVYGCDSTITTSVLINPMPDVTVSESNNVITANQNSASYQWIDCNDDNAIAGETAQTYTPTANGSYAVEVTLNGCTDTSACTVISTIGIEEFTHNGMYLYPNPVEDYIYIESDNSLEGVAYEIIDAQGRIVLEGSFGNSAFVNVEALSRGTYTIRIEEVQLQFVRVD